MYTAVYASCGGDISGRNLPAGAPFRVTQTSAFEWSPDISGNRVVWWEAGGRVMLKNLNTGKTHLRRPRLTAAHRRRARDLGRRRQGRLVRDRLQGRRRPIYVRNVARSTNAIKIAQKDLTCLFPAISGHTVVWESGPAQRVLSHIHIYGARLK